MSTLEGIEKAAVIERVCKRNVATKTWRSECEREVVGYLVRANARRPGDLQRFVAEKARVLAYCKEQYDAAGANWQGRW
jgi:erythromycin esterase-like protein